MIIQFTMLIVRCLNSRAKHVLKMQKNTIKKTFFHRSNYVFCIKTLQGHADPQSIIRPEFWPTEKDPLGSSVNKATPLKSHFLILLCSQMLPSGFILFSNLNPHSCPLNTLISRTVWGSLKLSALSCFWTIASAVPLAQNAISVYLHTSNPQGHLKCFSCRELSLSPQAPGNSPPLGPPKAACPGLLSSQHTQLCSWSLGTTWSLN